MKWICCSLSFVGMFTVLVVSNASAFAQGKTPRDVALESNRQELNNLLLRKPILATEDKSARLAVLKQINDDFKALQVLNNRVMSEVTADAKVDYKSLARLISEIGSKASRLKSNLVLPKSDVAKDKSDQKSLTASEFRERMMGFDKVVVSFSNNPIFKETNLVDIELGKKASADLEIIIEGSGKLKKVAQKLAKESGPSSKRKWNP